MGNNRNRANGHFDEWRRIGFNQNSVNTDEAGMQYMYISALTDLCMSRFKWNGLPDEIDVRFLEMNLFYHGFSVFYHDGRYDKYMTLNASYGGSIDYQNNPTSFNTIANNFVSVPVSAIKDTIWREQNSKNESIEYKIGKGIPIWANKMRTSDIDVVLIYAKKLAKLDRSVEINSDNARRSKFVVSNDAQRLTMKNLDRQLAEGNNNISINGQVNIDDIKALDLGVDPQTIVNLDIVRDRQWNKCMTLLGIESANQDKKERLVSDEVTANGDQTSMMRFVNLNERRVAAAKINKHYGTKITVEYYTDEERNAKMNNDNDNDVEEKDEEDE